MFTRQHHPLGAENLNSNHYGSCVSGITEAPFAVPAGDAGCLCGHCYLALLVTLRVGALGAESSGRVRRRPTADARGQTPWQVPTLRGFPAPQTPYAARQGEGRAVSGDGEAVLRVFTTKRGSGVRALWCREADCSSLSRTGRAAAPKSARQKIMERTTQRMSKIAIHPNAAFNMPLIEKCRASANSKPKAGRDRVPPPPNQETFAP
jgi:hypothetical protein